MPDVLWDVDFSSALENRTGKYFIGRDILADQRDLIGNVHYWRARPRREPEGGVAKLLKLGLKLETRLVSLMNGSPLPPRRQSGRTLHLDPFSVLQGPLGERDMVLVHDLGPVTHPELFQHWLQSLYSQAFRKISQSGCALVFVSEASRSAFAGRYGEAPRARVIYPQLRSDVAAGRKTAIPGLDAPFLLTVGSLGRRKNQLGSIRAFARSGLAARGFRYILCGAREPGAPEVERAAAATPGVVVLPYVTDAELSWLYSTARGFVLMSRLEGFGMPVAEAISHGCMPMVSRASVLEEVAGPAAITADVDDEEAIATQMSCLAEMAEAERQRRRQALQRSFARFTRARFAMNWSQALRAV